MLLVLLLFLHNKKELRDLTNDALAEMRYYQATIHRKNMKKLIYACVTLSMFLSSCASIYLAPQSVTKSKSHNKIAIIQPDIKVVERKTKVDVNSEDVKNQLAINIQNDMYAYMQNRNSKKNVHKIEILDIDKTNQILKNVDIKKLSNEELCKKLGVDAVLITKFSFEMKYSDQTAIILYILTAGLSASNKSCLVNANLYYCADGKNGWTYDYGTSGSGFTSYNGMSEALIKHFSKKTPYTLKRDK